MILVDNQQKTMPELAKMFNIPLDMIIKSSEFGINEDIKGYDLGSRKKRDAPPRKFPSFFYTEDKNGLSREIKYATSKANIKDKQGKINEVFSPKKVQIDGDVTLPNKIDLAVYLWLYPKNRQSPFRTADQIWEYQYTDKQANATARIGKGDKMLEALTHAKSAKGANLKLVAKGMGIANVDSMLSEELQAALSDLAMANPVAYLAKVGKRVTEFEGRIIDAIDKNIFVISDTFGQPKWIWSEGKNKGQLICEITNQTIGANTVLVNHIMSHINDYVSELMNLQQSLDARENAEAFLENQASNTAPIEEEQQEQILSGVPEFNEDVEDLMNEMEEDTDTDDDTDGDSEFILEKEDANAPGFPGADYKEAMAFASYYKGKNAAPAEAGKLRDELAKGTLNPSNIREWMKENLKY